MLLTVYGEIIAGPSFWAVGYRALFLALVQ